MAREKSSLYGFNHGIADRRALAHIDSKRLSVSAQTQINWQSFVLGHMNLRPGLGFVGEISGNPTLPPAPTSADGDTSIELGMTGVGDAAAACAGTGAVNRVQAAAFTALAGTVTFEEVALLSTNPVITAVMYGGSGPDVSTGPFFVGQNYQNIFDVDGPGYLEGTITAPLSVDATGASGDAVTVTDGAWSPNDTVLAGNSDFTLGQPFVIAFSTDVVGVAFTLGGFNSLGTCRVRAYDRNGNMLGSWTNVEGAPAPFETFYINRDSDTPIIAGISIEIDPSENNGVCMKNVIFSSTCADV
jgi:hypothetical protein